MDNYLTEIEVGGKSQLIFPHFKDFEQLLSVDVMFIEDLQIKQPVKPLNSDLDTAESEAALRSQMDEILLKNTNTQRHIMQNSQDQ